MKALLCFLVILLGAPVPGSAAPILRQDVFGRILGGWDAKGGKAADYEITGVPYRTWRPHVTPTLDGGIFISVRIDHLRGFLASDDHASLEIGFDRDGEIVSAQSTIGLQGRKITSDVVQGSARFGTEAAGVDRMARMGTELVASLTANLLREKVAEPGRVGFPAAVRHNYNLLCLAIDRDVHKALPVDRPDVPVESEPGEPVTATGEPGNDQPATDEPKAEAPAASDATPKDETRTPAPELTIREQGKPPVKVKTIKDSSLPTKG